MESSSDSFAWTDASSDSTDSGVMAVTNINKNESEEESESGKSYKKNLQKKLFTDHENDEEVQQKDRKRKIEQDQTDTESIDNPKKKRIKSEPETDDADVVVLKKKKKSKNEALEINGFHGKSQEYESNDESYLNKKVKEEQAFASPASVKHKNRSQRSKSPDGIEHKSSDSETPRKIKKKKGGCEYYDKDITMNNDYETNQEFHNSEEGIINSVQKKKKKSKKKERDNSVVDEESAFIEDKHNADETTVETKHRNNETISKLNENIGNTEMNNLINFQTSKRRKSITNLSKELLSENSDNDDNKATQLNNRNSDDYKCLNNDSVTSFHELTEDKSITDNSLIVPEKSKQRIPKLSEKIIYEDDSDIETEQDHSSQNVRQSDMLKQFINVNAHLRPFVQKVQSNCAFTSDDDIWVIKCPHEIDINSFKNKRIVLDKKCKIKIDSNTYEGSRVEENSNIAMLSSDHTKFSIKKLSVPSTIYLRKRIPKTHIQEDNIMINNQTNFIPLPETKCRHPLFGSHYKKAIKIPKAVSERLKAPPCESLPLDVERKRNKKHKQDRKTSIGEDPDLAARPAFKPEPELKLEPESDVSMRKKKKKKRKHTDNEYPVSEKSKITKHNLESIEAWESEKAIEENLFNF